MAESAPQQGVSLHLSVFFPYPREKILSLFYHSAGFRISPVRILSIDLGRQTDFPADLTGGFRQKRVDEKGDHSDALSKRPEHCSESFTLFFLLREFPRSGVINVPVYKRYEFPYTGKRLVKSEFFKIRADLPCRLAVGILYFSFTFR